MNVAVYVGKSGAESDERLVRLMEELEQGGWKCCSVETGAAVPEGTDMVLSVGGDGTFLSVAKAVAGRNILVAGVNMGRLGFLSENRPEELAEALLAGEYTVENRTLLHADVKTGHADIDEWPFALNEMSVRRSGAAMLGVEVTLDGVLLPIYWADGLVISTSSGSTAYSLSVGGPIVLPESRVLIISPIAPHNLNVRPLVVPDSSVVTLRMYSRDGKFEFSADNRTAEVTEETSVEIRMAQFSLRRVRLNRSNFINALTEKLYWGEDVRNIR